MSRSTISTFKLFETFPDAESARLYFESKLWPDGVKCPDCKSGERIAVRKGGFYRCNACRLDFTVRTGTIMERSHIPLHKWLYAMYLLMTARKGISSMQLAKEIGIRQSSAWFLLQRIRGACGTPVEPLKGIVEADETFIGGKENNKHMYRRIKDGVSEKVAVIGMRERGGNVIAKVLASKGGLAIRAAVQANVQPGTRLMADENPSYQALTKQSYTVDAVTHSTGEYVRGDIHTNSIESVWAVLKRGLHGVYHHASKKHIGRYVDEFTFRLNDGNVSRHTFERLDSLTNAITGKQITYKELTA
jgi:transposase-like protein